MTGIPALEARVRRYASERVPSLGHDVRTLLAVSGGADSTAMAAILCEGGVIDPARATVAHFDHGLRGAAAAARDRAVVEALCERYGLALIAGAWAQPRPGEAAAREARYRFLADAALAAGASCVATGHTEDDQVETIVLQTLRGRGARGTAGIAPERAWPHAGPARGVGEPPGPRLARPLLAVRRAETRAYCAARGLAFVDDETNDDPRLARNRVRAMLADVDAETPEARALILRTGELARASLATLEAAAMQAAPPRTAEGGRAVALDRGPLRRLGQELAPYAWRLAIEQLVGDARDFGRRHYAAMAAAAGARTGATFELPRGVVLTVDARELLLSVGPLVEPAVAPGTTHCLPFSGTLGAWEVDVRAAAAAAGAQAIDHADGQTTLHLPADAVLRARRPGDRVPLGAGRGHAKLHDVYIDAKVPRRRRDAAPVIAAGRDVLWSPLVRLVPGGTAAGGAPYAVRWRRVAESA
ncbi:MAG: tRNA lysidine(34) synthetase TilS [Chloroflexota bacterium]|nr:tRNA lysidine(34) synthetase TilS [Chloroflexota bacterium]